MKQILIKGEFIEESTIRSNEIQNDIEELLALVASAYRFNWGAPLHDIVRLLMNQVHEFLPLKEE